MIAVLPARHRGTGTISKRRIFVLLLLATLIGASAGVAWAATMARPAQDAQVSAVRPPAVIPTATPEPYRPAGPDLTLLAAYAAPLTIAMGPQTTGPVTLHLGPNPDYVAIGTLQSGALVEVVGRDESGEWLAIVFPPESTFRAWLPTALVEEAGDVAALPVEPVGWLP